MSKAGLGGFAAGLLLLVGVQGCALRNTDDRGAELQLEIARLRAAEQANRVAELEARLAKLEAGGAPASSASQQAVLERLDRLIELNRDVLMREAETAAEAPLSTDPAPALHTTAACDPNLTPQEQLQRLVEQIRGRRSSWRGGLSREEVEALRVLLRPERSLDASNPLRHW